MCASTGKEPPNFLQKDDLRFKSLHNAIDNVYRNLLGQGISIQTNTSATLTKEELGTLWSKSVLGMYSPLSLLRSIFCVFGMHACLRGGGEHQQLCFFMIQRSSLGWVYTEPFSKNRPGAAAALKISRKEVVIHTAPDEGCVAQSPSWTPTWSTYLHPPSLQTTICI